MASFGRKRHLRERRAWTVAPLWVALALILGFVTDDLAVLLRLSQIAPISSASATSILASMAAGMITFTGFVYSTVILVLQFGSSAYSPRLVRELGRHSELMGHSFGVFTGTFVYALLAIRSVDLAGRPGVNTAVITVAFLWLLASVVLFLRLVPEVRTLSVTHVLDRLGRVGRTAIARAYTPEPTPPGPNELPPATQVIRHLGPSPAVIQDLDTRALVSVAHATGGSVVIPHAIGDVLMPDAPLALIHGGERDADPRLLRRAITLGPDRATYRDPAFAMRLLVDIAIRALSPAINDPTTAVAALDQLEALLRELGRRPLDRAELADAGGRVRLVYERPGWEDLVLLALAEIQEYGRDSVQVQRRLNALLRELHDAVPEPRRTVLDRLMSLREPALDELARRLPEVTACDPQGLGHTVP
jgi:uncharacterized membrane protein